MRTLLIGLGVVLALLAGAYAAVMNVPAVQDALFKRVISRTLQSPPPPPEGLRVTVCGSASPLGNLLNRAQACIAVQTPEHLLLFDVGARSPVRIAQAQLPLDRLDGVFLTHFHSDHIAALPDINLASWVRGRPAPLKVFGPQGVDEVVDGFNTAYALDRRYRTAHHGADLLPPANGFMAAHTLNASGVAFERAGLTVTAFPVAHPPIEPALGYRVDYRGRSIVISGDSNVSETLFAVAEGTDLVIHDALSRAMLDPMIEAATAAGVPVLPRIMTDVIDYHADTTALAARAEKANIGRLVLYHLVPAPPNAIAARVFARGLPDDIILAVDLLRFDLPPDSDSMTIHEP
ncbi:MAG: MBL fold metallo-hydrolase [Pseudomonadota bacterium]